MSVSERKVEQLERLVRHLQNEIEAMRDTGMMRDEFRAGIRGNYRKLAKAVLTHLYGYQCICSPFYGEQRT